jgi:alanine racemase
MSAPVGRAVAIVDLGAIEQNVARLRTELAEGVELCAVVKADGYGHGAPECAAAALLGGATRLGVAAATEAFELRQRFSEVPILVLGALTEAEVDVALMAGAEISAWRPGFLELVAERAEALGVTPRIHVKHDSGMGRLGERDPETVLGLAAQANEDDRLDLHAVWTHFATADEPDSDFFDEQLARFTAVAGTARERWPGIVVHAANSAAVLRSAEAHFDMVRCGIAVYGLDPMNDDPVAHDLRPALSFRSWVADVKDFDAGDSAGYGRRWIADGPTRVGVIPIGYGDGVRRGLTNNAEVLVRGRRYPLVGTVSMDNITIDLGPDTDVEPGDEATLIGRDGTERVLAEDLARRLGTINYEITCGISARVPRVHDRSGLSA